MRHGIGARRRGGRWWARGSKGDVVVEGGVAGGQRREAGAIDFERVLELSDSIEEEVDGAEVRRPGGPDVLRRRQQLGVLCEEDLDDEESRRVEQSERLGDGQHERRRA